MAGKIEEKELNAFMNKVKKVEKGHELDLSSDEDLSIAVMNLISIEEHLFFTAQKTEQKAYFDLLFETREMRKSLLKKLIKEYDGEVWCISKHLLAASMRLMEVGTKALATQKKQAYEFFEQAYRLYNLFWALNLKLISKEKLSSEVKVAALEKISRDDNLFFPKTKEEKKVFTQKNKEAANEGWWSKLGSALNKALDCCRE